MTCHCGATLRPGRIDGQGEKVLCCPYHGPCVGLEVATPVRTRKSSHNATEDVLPAHSGIVVQPKIPGIDRGKQSKQVIQKEKDVEQSIIDGLTARGYIVLKTGKPLRKQRCNGCGNVFYPTGGNGNDAGVSDLLVTRKEWGNNWKFIEVKSNEKAERSDEQVRLAEMGLLTFVWSFEQAEDALKGE